MLRPSFLSSLALLAFAAVSFTGCRTMYSEMYSPKRNHFVPVKEVPKPAELLPSGAPITPGLPETGAVPPVAPPPADVPMPTLPPP